MRRQILWHVLGGSECDTTFVRASLVELNALIARTRHGLRIPFAPLDTKRHESALAKLEGGHPRGAADLLPAFDDAESLGLTVYCPKLSHPAVRAARSILPHAVWGISLSGRLSMTYLPGNRYIFWHETLHLLGVQDHYDVGTFQTTCGHAACVMQYSPSESSINGKHCLCPATIERIASALM